MVGVNKFSTIRVSPSEVESRITRSGKALGGTPKCADNVETVCNYR